MRQHTDREDIYLSRLCERLYNQLLVSDRKRLAEMSALKVHYETVLSGRDAQVADLTARLHTVEQEKNAILTSMSWRLSAPYRLAGRLVYGFVRLLKALLRSPRGAARHILHAMARAVRGNEILRKVVHKALEKAPGGLRERLARAAPSTAEQSGHALAISDMTLDCGGEWQWIYNRLQK